MFRLQPMNDSGSIITACNIFSEKVKCFLKIFTRFSSAKPVVVRG